MKCDADVPDNIVKIGQWRYKAADSRYRTQNRQTLRRTMLSIGK